jgi:hypothetical protein
MALSRMRSAANGHILPLSVSSAKQAIHPVIHRASCACSIGRPNLDPTRQKNVLTVAQTAPNP